MEDLIRHRPKMTLERAIEIRTARKEGVGWVELAKRFHISQTTLMAVLSATHPVLKNEAVDG